jgi:D-serine deaminase-like pyridoxal phosphate-dependent protein
VGVGPGRCRPRQESNDSVDATSTKSDRQPPPLPSAVVQSLPTPCLVVDIAAADRNIKVAESYFRDRPLKLRPHFKAHKCLDLIKRQLTPGSTVGVTCATAAEALALAKAGVPDILIANQIVDPFALAKLVEALPLSNLTIAVDALKHLEILSQTIPETSAVDVVVEIDTGYHRCGIPSDSPLLAQLAVAVLENPRIRLAGLMGYEGHAVLRPDRTERRALVTEAAVLLRQAQDTLLALGCDSRVVSGGGTGTYDLWSDAGVLTEVQAGSYVLMDATYSRLDSPFSQALYCLATVISVQEDRAVANAGLKSLSAEYGLPRLVGSDGEVYGIADEHSLIRLARPGSLEIGDRIWLVPAHVDPTVNLHRLLFAWDTDLGILEWAVSHD